jgi:hypothetical protein
LHYYTPPNGAGKMVYVRRLLGDLVSVDSPGGTGLDLIAVLIYLFEIGLLDMFAVTAGVQEDLVLLVLLRVQHVRTAIGGGGKS